MKKIIGLFITIFIITTSFGQSMIKSQFSQIETTPTGNNTIEDTFREDGFNGIKWKDGYGFIDWFPYVHFVRGDWFFMLAYEPVKDFNYGSKELFLYKKNINNKYNPWIKASRKIMTNSCGEYCYDEVSLHLAKKSFGNSGKVEINDKGNIEITFDYLLKDKEANQTKCYVFKYEFVPEYKNVNDGSCLYLNNRIYK